MAFRHPHFPSPLPWYTNLDEAIAEAKRTSKRLFVQHGRRTCAGSRALVERTVAKDEICEYLKANFLAVASSCDEPEPRMAEILAQLPAKDATPLCVYLDSDGRVLHCTAGGRPPAVFLNDLQQAMAKK